VDAPPSPKLHAQAVTGPTDWSVKVTVSGTSPERGAPLKPAATALLDRGTFRSVTAGGTPTIGLTWVW